MKKTYIRSESVRSFLRDFRKAKGMTQRDLAIKLDYPQSYVCDLEKKRYTPKDETLVKWAHALGVKLTVTITINGSCYTIEVAD